MMPASQPGLSCPGCWCRADSENLSSLCELSCCSEYHSRTSPASTPPLRSSSCLVPCQIRPVSACFVTRASLRGQYSQVPPPRRSDSNCSESDVQLLLPTTTSLQQLNTCKFRVTSVLHTESGDVADTRHDRRQHHCVTQ